MIRNINVGWETRLSRLTIQQMNKHKNVWGIEVSLLFDGDPVLPFFSINTVLTDSSKRLVK